MDGNGGCDLIAELCLETEITEGFDRLVLNDFLLVNADVCLLFQGVGDLLRGDGAEETAAVAGLCLDRYSDVLELFGNLPGLFSS